MHQCEVKHKKRTADEQKKLVTRLKRIEGQVRGIQKMVEDDLYSNDESFTGLYCAIRNI